MYFRKPFFVSVVLSVALGFSGFVTSEALDSSTVNKEDFSVWLQALKQEAVTKGISKETVNDALGEVRFIERVIKSDRAQAEFKESYQDYIGKRVSEWRVNKGREYLDTHYSDISKVTLSYDVPARFVVAIIGVETNYGTFTLKHGLFNVLSTLAYDKRRGPRFRKEIFAALEILDSEAAQFDQLKSSWAGALGVPQFMPSTYLQFAVDYDGDGKKNIWDHGPDLWASVANYLKHYGWSSKQAWARKVLVPPEQMEALSTSSENVSPIPKDCARYKKHLQGWKVLSGWNDAGVRRMSGSDLPLVDIPASMILTDPDLSHGYLVYENFCTLMRYNPSFKYALSVGVLSDELKQVH